MASSQSRFKVKNSGSSKHHHEQEDEELTYEQLLNDPSTNELYVCDRCQGPAYVRAGRQRMILWLIILLLMVVVWTGFIALYMGNVGVRK